MSKNLCHIIIDHRSKYLNLATLQSTSTSPAQPLSIIWICWTQSVRFRFSRNLTCFSCRNHFLYRQQWTEHHHCRSLRILEVRMRFALSIWRRGIAGRPWSQWTSPLQVSWSLGLHGAKQQTLHSTSYPKVKRCVFFCDFLCVSYL